MERYSLKQCQAQLGGIDFKTLQRWMKKSNIEPGQGKNDERFKYLTREQLELLAHEHERELPHDVTPPKDPSPLSHAAYKLLLDRITALEEQHQAEQEARTEHYHALQTAISELSQRTEGITLLLEERRRQKIAEESELANVLSSLKLQLDVVQSQANSFVEWYNTLQRTGEQNSRDIQKLGQAVQALPQKAPTPRRKTRSSSQ